jgi:hypothetical protein
MMWRRRSAYKTPECVHTVWEIHVAAGIVRGANGWGFRLSGGRLPPPMK